MWVWEGSRGRKVVDVGYMARGSCLLGYGQRVVLGRRQRAGTRCRWSEDVVQVQEVVDQGCGAGGREWSAGQEVMSGRVRDRSRWVRLGLGGGGGVVAGRSVRQEVESGRVAGGNTWEELVAGRGAGMEMVDMGAGNNAGDTMQTEGEAGAVGSGWKCGKGRESREEANIRWVGCRTRDGWGYQQRK